TRSLRSRRCGREWLLPALPGPERSPGSRRPALRPVPRRPALLVPRSLPPRRVPFGLGLDGNDHAKVRVRRIALETGHLRVNGRVAKAAPRARKGHSLSGTHFLAPGKRGWPFRLHGLKSWGRNLSRKVRETRSSSSQKPPERSAEGATHFVAPTSACTRSRFTSTGRASGREKEEACTRRAGAHNGFTASRCGL